MVFFFVIFVIEEYQYISFFKYYVIDKMIGELYCFLGFGNENSVIVIVIQVIISRKEMGGV